MSEILVILVVALLVFGPEKLPSLARTLGKLVRKVNSLRDEFQATLDKQILVDTLEENEHKAAQADKRYE